MFSNFSGIVGRKGSSDRQSAVGHTRQPSAGGPAPSGSPYDRIRHPQHIHANPHSYESSIGSPIKDNAPVSPYSPTSMSRHDSQGSSSSATGYPIMHRSPAQLPEEMRARERERQLERERDMMRERERARDSHKPRQSSTPSQSGQDGQEPARYSSNHMESSVTRLLVATKMLLESLTKWSLGERTETQVSDIYVRLGNDFNSARLAFGSYGIDMSDLASVPDDLRACLERCLSEDASPAVLEVHLPRIREIIINLLQGLKMKQAQYKQFLVQQRASNRESHRASISSAHSTQQQQQQQAARRSRGHSSRAERVGVSEGAGTPEIESSPRPDSLQRASSAGAPGSHARQATGDSPVLPSRNSLGRSAARARASSNVSESITAPSVPTEATPAAATAAETQPQTISKSTTGGSPLKQSVALPEGQPTDSVLSLEPAEVSATAKSPSRNSMVPPDVVRHSLVDTGAGTEEDDEDTEEIADPVATTEEKLNGIRSQRSSTRHTPKASIETIDTVDADPSLRALKSRDALERRASKRFSAYTFNKMGVGQGFGSSGLGLGMLTSATSASGSPLPERRGNERRTSGSRRAAPPTPSSRPPLPDGAATGSGPPSPAVSTRSSDYFSGQAPSISPVARPRPRQLQQPQPGERFESIEEVKTPVSPNLPASEGGASIERTPSDGGKPVRRGSLLSRSQGANSLLSPPGRAIRGNSMAISSTESLPYTDAVSPTSELEDALPATATSTPRQPPIPTPEERTRLDASQDRANTSSNSLGVSASAALPSQLRVYVQLGRQTRKAMLELDHSDPLTRGITIARLRMLFVDRFAYSPGMDDFPSICIKDPASGVSYELEDLSDIQEGCVLTLNIEPLDQVKQHLDLSLGSITREIRELKAALLEKEREARRISHSFVADSLHVANAHATPTKISESQFQAAGQRVAQLKRANTRAAPSSSGGAAADETLVAVARGGSERMSFDAASTTSSAGGNRVAQELKVQYDELQSLRREFAIMRQLQCDFDTDFKGVLSSIREQAGKVRAIASTEVAAERNFIIAGKAKLDSSSQEVLTLVEDLQDTVDDLKQDVIQRGVKPKPAQVKQITADIERATRGLLELENYVQTVKPSWKKTWESELQNIVDEQEFLNHQEGLLADLRDDHTALQEVFANIQQVVKLRGSRGGKYIPPLPEEGHEGLSTVMLEVKSQMVNHEKRLRALQAAERQRQKDMASRSDEFAEELAGFVDGKALRKTGGHMEAERVRQKRDHATLKAMFGGGGPGGVPPLETGGVGGGSAAGTVDKPKRLILGKAGEGVPTTPTDEVA